MAASGVLHRAVLCGSPISFLLLIYQLLVNRHREPVRYGGYRHSECAANFIPLRNHTCVRCPSGHFSLRGWVACLPQLNCVDISHDVRTRRRLGSPGHLNAVKDVFLADWFGYDVVYSRCRSAMFADDCLRGMEMVERLQASEFVVQLIGMCHESLEVSWLIWLPCTPINPLSLPTSKNIFSQLP